MTVEIIIGAMATAIMGLCGWIVKQSLELRRVNEERIKAKDEMVKLLRDLLKAME